MCLRKLSALLCGFALLLGFAVTPVPANAFSVEGPKWPLGSYTWCTDSNVAAHSWTGFITSDVGQYNSLSSSFTVPSWSGPVGGCSGSKVSFTQGSIAAGLCGLTTYTTTAGGTQMQVAQIQYSLSKTYWRGASTGNCNFDFTSLHEFGHTQGLGHSCTVNTVMWKSDNAVTSLTGDDKAGEHYLYGATYTGTPPTAPCN